jgi:hypothetical protein
VTLTVGVTATGLLVTTPGSGVMVTRVAPATAKESCTVSPE